MSNQTPDRSHASGTFVGADVIAPPFTDRVINSKAISGAVRNSAGNYTITLSNALAFAEGNADARLPANFLGIAGATIAPDGGSVLVTVFDLQGAPADPPTFGLEVRSIEEGEGQGPQPVLPGPPTPPAGASKLLGWVVVNLNAVVQEVSAPDIVDTITHPALGNYEYTLIAGTPLAAAVCSADGVLPTDTTSQVGGGGPLTCSVRTFNGAATAADRGHSLFFYSV